MVKRRESYTGSISSASNPDSQGRSQLSMRTFRKSKSRGSIANTDPEVRQTALKAALIADGKKDREKDRPKTAPGSGVAQSGNGRVDDKRSSLQGYPSRHTSKYVDESTQTPEKSGDGWSSSLGMRDSPKGSTGSLDRPGGETRKSIGTSALQRSTGQGAVWTPRQYSEYDRDGLSWNTSHRAAELAANGGSSMPKKIGSFVPDILRQTFAPPQQQQQQQQKRQEQFTQRFASTQTDDVPSRQNSVANRSDSLRANSPSGNAHLKKKSSTLQLADENFAVKAARLSFIEGEDDHIDVVRQLPQRQHSQKQQRQQVQQRQQLQHHQPNNVARTPSTRPPTHHHTSQTPAVIKAASQVVNPSMPFDTGSPQSSVTEHPASPIDLTNTLREAPEHRGVLLTNAASSPESMSGVITSTGEPSPIIEKEEEGQKSEPVPPVVRSVSPLYSDGDDSEVEEVFARHNGVGGAVAVPHHNNLQMKSVVARDYDPTKERPQVIPVDKTHAAIVTPATLEDLGRRRSVDTFRSFSSTTASFVSFPDDDEDAGYPMQNQSANSSTDTITQANDTTNVRKLEPGVNVTNWRDVVAEEVRKMGGTVDDASGSEGNGNESSVDGDSIYEDALDYFESDDDEEEEQEDRRVPPPLVLPGIMQVVGEKCRDDDAASDSTVEGPRSPNGRAPTPPPNVRRGARFDVPLTPTSEFDGKRVDTDSEEDHLPYNRVSNSPPPTPVRHKPPPPGAAPRKPILKQTLRNPATLTRDYASQPRPKAERRGSSSEESQSSFTRTKNNAPPPIRTKDGTLTMRAQPRGTGIPDLDLGGKPPLGRQVRRTSSGKLVKKSASSGNIQMKSTLRDEPAVTSKEGHIKTKSSGNIFSRLRGRKPEPPTRFPSSDSEDNNSVVLSNRDSEPGIVPVTVTGAPPAAPSPPRSRDPSLSPLPEDNSSPTDKDSEPTATEAAAAPTATPPPPSPTPRHRKRHSLLPSFGRKLAVDGKTSKVGKREVETHIRKDLEMERGAAGGKPGIGRKLSKRKKEGGEEGDAEEKAGEEGSVRSGKGKWWKVFGRGKGEKV